MLDGYGGAHRVRGCKLSHPLLVLAVWVVNFAGACADGTRPNTEVGRTKNVSYASLGPVASFSNIAVVELCPKEDFFPALGIIR